jgi:IBR domain, a half RING-finger domain
VKINVNSFLPCEFIADCESIIDCYRFERAAHLRQALARCEPRLTSESLSVAAGLHSQLIVYGYMYDIFADSSLIDTPDETGEAFPYDLGQVTMARIDREDTIISVPILTRFFKRLTEAKECTICTESYHEIDTRSPQEWTSACEGFEGPWTATVMAFPTKTQQKCEHSLDVCKSCFARHLDGQLIQNARSPVGSLTCPECRRALDSSEIRNLASEDTIQKCAPIYDKPNQFTNCFSFDKCLLRQHLATEPGFRWCLRAGCDNGDLHEEEEYMDPHIRCSVCEFEMCFTHQIPWHEGMSCQQYSSQRAHGDPDNDQTQQWLRDNTKNCPGCGVSIQKGEACFHMTCKLIYTVLSITQGHCNRFHMPTRILLDLSGRLSLNISATRRICSNRSQCRLSILNSWASANTSSRNQFRRSY